MLSASFYIIRYIAIYIEGCNQAQINKSETLLALLRHVTTLIVWFTPLPCYARTPVFAGRRCCLRDRLKP
jgi:hypothetical protein